MKIYKFFVLHSHPERISKTIEKYTNSPVEKVRAIDSSSYSHF